MTTQEFKNSIQSELKSSMMAKDQVRTETLRSIVNSITVFEKNNPGKNVDVVSVIGTMAKQRQQSIDAYSAAGNSELAERESQELAILNTYLPKKMSEAEIAAGVSAAIAKVQATSPKDMGKAVAEFKSQYPGQDMGMVSKLIKDALTVKA